MAENNMTNAISKRVSRRSFLSKNLGEQEVNKLKEEINNINQKSGLKIEFVRDGSKGFSSLSKSYGMFKGVKSVLVLKGDKNDIDLKEKAGYYGEYLILEATEMNLGTCWVGGTFDKDYNGFNCSEDEEIICVIPIGYVEENQSFKEKMIYKMMHRKTKSISEMLFSDKAEPPQWIKEGMEAVQKAPSALNSQKTIIEYKNGIVKAIIADDYKFDLTDLGIAKLHFEIGAKGKFEIGNGGEFKHFE